jgi:cytochrome P450
MVTLTSRADIEAALADPLLVPLPSEPGPEGSMAWLRATVARFAHGEVHARRRMYVEAELARIDVDGLRRLAAGAVGDDRTRVLRALAEAMGLPRLDDAAVGALRTVADNYFGGDDPAADDAVRQLLPLMKPGGVEQTHDVEQTYDMEQAANRIGILIQACDATAGLIAATRDGSGDVHATLRTAPPVQVMKRTAIGATRIGDVEIPDGELVLLEVGPLGLSFGAGPRVCPGQALALALAEGALESPSEKSAAPAV